MAEQPGRPAPSTIIGRVDELDARIDAAFAPFRGTRAADWAAAVLSNLADYGFIWVVVAAVKARRPGATRRRAMTALTVAGVGSFTVNAAVKAVVRRRRPETGPRQDSDAPLLVRSPRSSSFPSGHTLAAFCTAVVLADGPGETAAFVGFATAVALSRVHLQAHHASDVMGGAIIGTAVGASLRRLLTAGSAGGTGPGGGTA